MVRTFVLGAACALFISSSALAAETSSSPRRYTVFSVLRGFTRLPRHLPGPVKVAARWGTGLLAYSVLTAQGVHPAVAGGGSYLAGEVVHQLTKKAPRSSTAQPGHELAAVGIATLFTGALSGLIDAVGSLGSGGDPMVMLQASTAFVSGVVSKFIAKAYIDYHLGPKGAERRAERERKRRFGM